MLSYLVKRLVGIIPVLLIVSIFTFLLIHIIPGDPAGNILGPHAPKEEILALRSKLGLDQPIFIQYFNWLNRLFSGDMGESITTGRPVLQMILMRLPVTLAMTLLATVISILIAIPLGVIAAVKQNSKTDLFSMLAALLGISVPSFWLGIMLIYLFSVKLGWLPSIGYVPLTENFREASKFLILPAASMGMVLAAVVTRMVRSSMLEVLRQEYITTARSKGLSELAVIIRHGLKNALIPVITVIGLNFGYLLGSTVVIEQVFTLPGVGSMVITAILGRDYPVLQGVLLFITFFYLIINLIVDMLYSFLDPRIRLS